jgi:hypothetical protein
MRKRLKPQWAFTGGFTVETMTADEAVFGLGLFRPDSKGKEPNALNTSLLRMKTDRHPA